MIPAIAIKAALSKAASAIGLKGFLAIGAAIALGICWWGWSRAADQRDEARETIAELVAASKAAQRLAESQKATVEQRYRELAERASNDHENANLRASDAADRYIASNRVQCPSDRRAASPAIAAAEDHGASVFADVPADPFVAVSESDVRACSAAAAYAVSAFEWASGLEKD